MTPAGVYAWALLALNAADAGLSWALFSSGLATEANPVMAEAWSEGLGSFIGMKAGLALLGVVALWMARRHRWALSGLRTCSSLYGAVVVLEVLMLLSA